MVFPVDFPVSESLVAKLLLDKSINNFVSITINIFIWALPFLNRYCLS